MSAANNPKSAHPGRKMLGVVRGSRRPTHRSVGNGRVIGRGPVPGPATRTAGTAAFVVGVSHAAASTVRHTLTRPSQARGIGYASPRTYPADAMTRRMRAPGVAGRAGRAQARRGTMPRPEVATPSRSTVAVRGSATRRMGVLQGLPSLLILDDRQCPRRCSTLIGQGDACRASCCSRADGMIET